MGLEVELPDEAVRRLKAEAHRRGLSIDGLISKLTSELPPAPTGPGRRPAFVAVGESGTGTTDHIEDLLAEGFGLD